MGKFCGKIGFVITREKEPSLWVEDVIERPYFGDIINYSRNLQQADKVNDDVKISSTISIIGDPFIHENLYSIKYVTFMNAKWKVETATPDFPRISLTLGGLYNEKSTRTGC